MTIATSPSRSVKAIRIYCPVDRATMTLIAEGRFPEIRRDTAFSAIMDIVTADNPLGDFGAYTSVVEISHGWELFTPGIGARPALGDAGARTASPTAILTVHIPGDAPPDAVSQAISAIMAAHPWETPVIELSEISLATRG